MKHPESTPVFGTTPLGTACTKRSAAYVVIAGRDGRVAAIRTTVRGGTYYWLPGGGSRPGETPEATVGREVSEELGRAITLTGKLGEAVEFFYATDEQWYEMKATFFRGEFDGEATTGEATTIGEHEFCWLSGRQHAEPFFHACHAWAASQI